MTDSPDLSRLQSIRIDGDALWGVSPEVHRAAEVLLAYLAGLEEGRRAAEAEYGQIIPEVVTGQVPATAAGEVPGLPQAAAGTSAAIAAPAAGRATRRDLEDHAAAVHAAEEEGAEGLNENLCGPILEEPIQDRTQYTPGPGFSSRQVAVVWGPGAAERIQRMPS